jgi:hypothetical protein
MILIASPSRNGTTPLATATAGVIEVIITRPVTPNT